MKRCPQCRRDYYDETLIYCLDDGTQLLEGPGSGEAPTAMFAERDLQGAHTSPSPWTAKRILILSIGVLLIGGVGFWLSTQTSKPKTDPSSGAYDKYMRGKVLVGSENRADVQTAIGLLEQSVADDPQFASAWAALARAYHIRAFYFAAGDERKRLNQDAEVAVQRALAIDPDLAEGHFARGLLLWTHAKRFPHEQSVQSYKRALALNPKMDDANHQLGVIYFHLGLFDKALAEIGKALEINPSNTLARFRYGVIDIYRGRYADAEAFFKSTPLETNPSLHAFQSATVLFKLGRVDEASEVIDRYLNEYPNDEGGVGTSVKAMILAKAGKAAEAEAAIKRAEELGRDFGHFHHTAYNIASAYALLKKPDQAVDYLQLAADDGFPCYPLFENDEVFKDMRQNPRYIALLAKLKQQWERYNATL